MSLAASVREGRYVPENGAEREGNLMSTDALTRPAVPKARQAEVAREHVRTVAAPPKRSAKPSWRPRQLVLVSGVLVGVGVLAYLNREAFDPSLWTARLHFGWAALAVVLSALTLAGNSWNLMGASPVRLKFWPTYAAQAAGTVARLVSPAAIGGSAVNVQYLRRAGVGGAASVGTVSVAQAVQLVSALVFLPPIAILAGMHLPGVTGRTGWIVAGVAVVLAIAGGIAVLVVRRRPVLEARARVLLAELATSIRTMASRPAQAAVSLAGSFVISAALIGTLWASVHAFGGSIGLLAAAVVLLFGSTAGNAIPVPGGVGTMDAAFVAGLVAAGVDLTVALPAVALHRLLTLWLQVPAGLVCAGVLRRRGQL
jgi:uncharacterized membrane protein YbhN (UPF0104 family)